MPVLIFLLLYFGLSVADNGINNFNFISANTVYGSKLPQSISIKGTYYMDVDEYDNLFGLKHLAFFKRGFINSNNQNFSIEFASSKGPWICQKRVDELLANITEDNHKITTKNVKLLDDAASNFDIKANTISNFRFDPTETFIPVKGCRRINLIPFNANVHLSDIYQNKVFEFEETVVFDTFQPVLFVDYFGMAAFNYKQKVKVQDPMKDVGQPLRFCDGSKFGEVLYTPEPRPVCPTELSDKRIHEKGVITVYKPNIVPVTRRLNRCQEGNTKIFSGKSFCCFGEHYDNRPQQTIKQPTSLTICEQMRKTKKSPAGDLKVTDKGKMDMNEFSTNNDKSFDYGGAFDFSSHERKVQDFFLDVATLKVRMPSLQMETPWGSIPRNKLYQNTHTSRDARLVWEPFVKEDLCLYVPRITTEVDAVHYPNADSLIEISPSSGADETTFFVSENVKGVWSVDDTMILKDVSRYNCIKMGPRDVIYLTKNGEIIKWSKDRQLHPAAKSRDVAHLLGAKHQDHGHFSYVEITKASNGRVVDVQNKHADGHDAGDQSVINMSKIKQPNTPQKQLPAIPTNSADQTTWQDALAYIQYQQTELQNANIHARAIAECHQAQLEHDLFVAELDKNPAKIIGSRIREAVDVIHAGNGFYAVKKCELIYTNSIFPSLFTNDTLEYNINGKSIPFRELVAKLGVYPSNGKCLSFPLIKFRLTGNNFDTVGQLTRDGTINTHTAQLMEDCLNDRSLVFNLNNMTYFFKDYQLLGKAATHDVMRKLSAVDEGSDLIKQGSNAPVLEPIREMINSINLIPITSPLVEKKFKHYPTGQVVTSRYSMMEKQAGLMSLIRMQEERTYFHYKEKVWLQRSVSDYSGSKGKSNSGIDNFGTAIADVFASGAKGIVSIADHIASGAGDVLSGIGGGVSSLGDGIGDAVGSIGGGVGSAVGDIGNGVGSAVGDIGKGVGEGVGALGKGFSSILTTIIIPVVIVIVVAVGGYFIYSKFIANQPEKARMTPSYEETINYDEEYGQINNIDFKNQNDLRKRRP